MPKHSKRVQYRPLRGEQLEWRLPLAGTSFPGNECPPDLIIPAALMEQTVQVGQLLTVDLRGTAVDRNNAGQSTGDVLGFQLDPDVGTDTPQGATITTDGVFRWSPLPSQVGRFKISVIVVDRGTPRLADVESFFVTVGEMPNQPPVLVPNPVPLEYGEDDGPVVIDSTLLLTDSDDSVLIEAAIRFTEGFASTQDELAFTNQNGIIGTYNSVTGLLTLTGTASVADYQTALRSVTYRNSSQVPSTIQRVITFQASDGQATGTATRAINVTSVNDAPQVTTSDGPLEYLADSPPTPIDPGLLVTDVDDVSLHGAEVRFTSGFSGTQAELGFTNQNGITGVYNPATGVLTLTGAASVANYQAALRSVTYFNSSATPSTAERVLQFEVNDGEATGIGTRSISVLVNHAPNLSPIPDQTATVGEELVVNITATDADGDVLTFLLDADDAPESASLEQTSNTTALIRWTPTELDAPGPVLFRVLVVDDGNPSLSDAESFDVEVLLTPNEAPQITTTAGSGQYTENASPLVVDSGLIVSDPDSNLLVGASVRVTSGFTQGQDILAATLPTGISGGYNATTGVLSLSGNASVTQYQIALRSVTYSNNSDNPSTNSRQITFTVDDGRDTASAARTVEVNGVNDAPQIVTSLQPLSYTEDDPPTPIDPGLVVSDPDNSMLTGGTVRITAGLVPDEDFLAFANQGNIVGIYDEALGILTLTGVDSVAAYQAALRSVTYSNVGDAPTTGSRTVKFAANDGSDMGMATRMVEVSTLEPRQLVTVTPSEQMVAPSQSFTIDVTYTTATPPDETLTGLALRMHFDSTRLTFDGFLDVLQTSLLDIASVEVEPDAGDFDSDPNTDSLVLVTWLDVAGNWPGVETTPVELFTAQFIATEGFDDSTVIRFTAESTAAGYSLIAEFATIMSTIQ